MDARTDDARMQERTINGLGSKLSELEAAMLHVDFL